MNIWLQLCKKFPSFYGTVKTISSKNKNRQEGVFYPCKLLLCEISILFIQCCVLSKGLDSKQKRVEELKAKLLDEQEEQAAASRKGKNKKSKSKKKDESEEEEAQGPTLQEQICEIENKPLYTFYSAISPKFIQKFFKFFD